jgi:DNA-binding NarL/FixJ family response regulator
MASKMASILLIEDHMIFVNAIKRLLTGQPGLEIIDIIQSVEEGLKNLLVKEGIDLLLVYVSFQT